MCVEVKQVCECGNEVAAFHLRDHLMGKAVIDCIYCTACSNAVTFNSDTMLRDNGWIIVYDMAFARMLAISKMSVRPDDVMPAYLFDEGLAT